MKSPSFIHALMLLSIILAASSFPVGAIITNALPPEVLMFLRFLLATLLFLPFIFYKHGFLFYKSNHLKISSIFSYMIISIPVAIFFWCMFESLRYTSVINTGAIYTLIPALTAISAYFINKEKTDNNRVLGFTIGTLGALWIVFRGDWNALINLNLNYGDMVFLIGSLFLSLYNPLVKRFYKNEPMEIMTFWIMLFTSLWLFIPSIASLADISWNSIEKEIYFGIVYLAIFTTLITFFLLNYCTVRMKITKVAAYGFLTPIFIIGMSLMLGLEKFQPIIIPGVVMIGFAMWIIQREKLLA